jgi:hypothetical protein
MAVRKVVCGIVCFLLSNLWADQGASQATLEKVFAGLKTAAATGSVAKVQKFVSARLLGTMRNSLASAGLTLTPDYIKDIGSSFDFAGARFVRSFEKGPTVGLVYSKTEKDDKKGIEFIFIKYVKESDGWKFDGGFDLTDNAVDAKGKKREFTEGDIPEKLAIDGNVLPAPPLAKAAEFPASLFIFGQGYKTTVVINGGEPVVSDGGSSSGEITGGLKAGVNTIEIEVVKIQAKMDMYPTIEVKYLDKKKTEKTAFSVETAKKKTGKWSEEFQIP